MAKTLSVYEGEKVVGHMIECPACGCGHLFENDDHPNTKIRGTKGWTFNGDLEKPTFRPSMLSTALMHVPEVTAENFEEFKRNPWPQTKKSTCCHSYVTDGKIEFLGDCTHDLKGQTVDLPDM